MQKVADLFTGFSLIIRRHGRWHQATAVGQKRSSSAFLAAKQSNRFPTRK